MLFFGVESQRENPEIGNGTGSIKIWYPDIVSDWSKTLTVPANNGNGIINGIINDNAITCVFCGISRRV